MNATASRPAAPAVFFGIQKWDGLFPDTALFNLTADVAGHPVGSTVSAQTLERLGFAVPAIPAKAA
jgi:hypothetical protein